MAGSRFSQPGYQILDYRPEQKSLFQVKIKIGFYVMKIAQITSSYFPHIGGVETHVNKISELLAEKGHEVTILTTDSSGKLPSIETIRGVKVIRFNSLAVGGFSFFPEGFIQYLKQNSKNFDILHAQGYTSMASFYAARAKSSNKFVFTPHYFGKGSTAFRTFLHVPYTFFGKKIFDKADAILSTSEYEKNLVHHDFGVDLRRITIIPNGVSLNDFSRNEKNKHDGRIIIYVGRLEKFKGVDYAIKALPYLDQDIKLEIVGDGSYYASLVKIAKKLGVADRVIFFGGNLSKKEIFRKYANADLAILLSKHECFGLTIAEALASGTACIVANTTALTEWVDNKNCFGTHYPIDIKELVCLINATIGKPVNDPKLVDWNDVVDRIIRVYVRGNTY